MEKILFTLSSFQVSFINITSKTHQLRQPLWDSKPTPQNSLSFEPTWVFWNPLIMVWLRYKAFSYLLYSMIDYGEHWNFAVQLQNMYVGTTCLREHSAS